MCNICQEFSTLRWIHLIEIRGVVSKPFCCISPLHLSKSDMFLILGEFYISPGKSLQCISCIFCKRNNILFIYFRCMMLRFIGHYDHLIDETISTAMLPNLLRQRLGCTKMHVLKLVSWKHRLPSFRVAWITLPFPKDCSEGLFLLHFFALMRS